ncbi:MAG TPA: hypothetical protein VH619_16225 [Verrucomicrobiae bacterium]|jgi:hypothetical protein|nr:hypothetical protein [Verrucomicrobiae bacterium]
MTTVGDREVLFTQSFMIPGGEQAAFDVIKAGVKVILRFAENPIDPNKPATSSTFADNVLTITLTDFRNQQGTAFKNPRKLGNLGDGRPFGFNVVHHLFGTLNFVTVQFYAGGDYL